MTNFYKGALNINNHQAKLKFLLTFAYFEPVKT